MKVRCLDVRRRMRLFRDHRRLSLLTKKGFENIFWGVLITVLDFRIVGINLLPDFMGFFLISRGLIQCAEYSWAFVKAKYLSIGLAIITIPDIVEIFIIDNCLYPYYWVNAFWPIYAIGGILNLVMMGFLLIGIKQLAQEMKEVDLEINTKYALGAYLISEGLLIALFLFSHFSCPHLISPILPGLLILISMIVGLFGLLIFIGVLYVLNEAKIMASKISSQADVML